jgi:hypothetical protein
MLRDQTDGPRDDESHPWLCEQPGDKRAQRPDARFGVRVQGDEHRHAAARKRLVHRFGVPDVGGIPDYSHIGMAFGDVRAPVCRRVVDHDDLGIESGQGGRERSKAPVEKAGGVPRHDPDPHVAHPCIVTGPYT